MATDTNSTRNIPESPTVGNTITSITYRAVGWETRNLILDKATFRTALLGVYIAD